MPPRTLLLVVPLLLLALALAGCGSSLTTTVVRQPAPAPEPSAARPSTDGPPLAARAGRLGGGPVTLEILSLHRKAAVTTLTVRVTTRSPEELDVGDAFDDGLLNVGPSGRSSINNGDSLDGITLIDGAHAMRYLVGRDQSGTCYCDNDLTSAAVSRAAPRTFSAVFGAPPPDVTAVDVVVPGFGTFTDVPLS